MLLRAPGGHRPPSDLQHLPGDRDHVRRLPDHLERRRTVESGDQALEPTAAIAERTGARVIDHDVRLFVSRPPTDSSDLTDREREVMEHVRRGATNDQIARALGISAATVRTHLEHVFAKLDVSTRTAAVAWLAEGETAHRGGYGE